LAKLSHLGDSNPSDPNSDDVDADNQREGVALISSLTERSSIFLFSYAPRLRSLVSWSKNAAQILGVKDSAIARDGNLFLRHVHPDDRFLLMTDLETALKDGGQYRATYRWIRPDNNEVCWLHCRATVTEAQNFDAFPIQFEENTQLLEGIIIDLTHELSCSAGTLAGADSINTILQAFPTMVFAFDRDLRLVRANRPLDEAGFTFGDPNFITAQFRVGRPFLNCFSDAVQLVHYQNLLGDILEGRQKVHRTRIAHDDQVFNLEVIPLNESEVTQGVLMVISNISDLAHLERQLAEVQRAEAIRLLAAGISHNFNNALQGIIGHAAAITSHPERTDLVREAAQSIIEIVNRSAELTRQMVILDDSQSGLVAPLDLNLAAMAAVNRVEDLFMAGVKVAVVFGSPPSIAARQDAMVEVIEALLRNARESMADEGSLAIKTYQVQLSDYEVEDLRAGTYAKLMVTDSGKGMEAEARKRCTEPFYTTKDRDPITGVNLKGKGLGLSKAHGIVRKLGGAILVESHPGSGTAISVLLPAYVAPAQSVMAQSATPIAGEPPTSAPDYMPELEVTESPSNIVPLFSDSRDDSSSASQLAPAILVVDDDLLVLETVAAILREIGYHCLTAENFSRALTLLRTQGQNLQLVLLDAVMPGMDGPTLLRQMRRIKPNLTVIGFSGAAPEHTDALLAAGAVRIVRKPVSPETLRTIVRQAFVRQEPVRQEPVRQEPVRQEPVRQEPVQQEPVQQAPIPQALAQQPEVS